jgi:hypothetical protein
MPQLTPDTSDAAELAETPAFLTSWPAAWRPKLAQAARTSRRASARVNRPAAGSVRERLRPAIAARAAHLAQGLSTKSARVMASHEGRRG